MALSWWSRSVAASCELYVDKVVKFISGLLQLLLGLAVVILTHVLKECEGLQTFSILVLCQAASLLLFLLLWYWCYGQDVASHVQELIQHVNHLTNQYKRYSDGVSRGAGLRGEVRESTLHADLDNYLEYLLHVLTVQGQRIYARHLVKWIVVLVVCLLWLVGFVVLVVTCGLPDQLYLKVLCVLPNLILVGTVAVVTFHVVHDLCRRHAYTNTFFYRATPGAMDTRLSEVVEETFNPRYVWLLSAHCWRNAHLCTNAGLAKALARKYSYVSHQHRHDRWRDQHFPTLRSDQVERFQFSSEQFVRQRGFRGDAGCCQAMLWCCLDSGDSRGNNPSGAGRPKGANRKRKVGAGDGADHHHHHHDGDASSGYSSTGVKASLHMVAEDGYMTPHLFVRKLAKEAYTPEQLLDEDLTRKRKKADRKSDLSRGAPAARDDLHVASTGPQRFPPRAPDRHAARGRWLSRDDTEVDYGAFYQPHDPDPHRMQREYDPLTYGVRMSVKKEMAKEIKQWKP